MERKEALQRINNLINFAHEAIKEDCPYIGINEDDLTALLFASLDMEIKPQNKWFDFIDKGLLKARHGDYVIYKVDFLLDNLAREVSIMEDVRKMRGKNSGYYHPNN